MRKRNRSLNLFNRKGNVAADSITWVIVIVVFMIVATISIFVSREINNQFIAEETFDAEKQGKLTNLIDRMPSFVDGAVLFLIIGFWIAVIIASVLIDSNPVFAFIIFIVSGLMMLLGMVLANIWDDFATDADIATVVSDLPITDFVFTNFPFYILIVVLSIGIVLYAKRDD